eukprot:TRINITY_DN3985_c0_g1_i5.p2 TRINITY_DN3985_c0_g1~~TRINITY_DN3985_c0_g1_i5.p2  ORF type:complete len:127 (-),score=18.22 TRINITY_DN3985_c0_g1_i5:195-575(-)
MQVEYIRAEQLANLLLGPGKNKTVVIDVRSHDFNDVGHIKGCLNIPSDDFGDDDDVDDLIQKHFNDIEKVIVHCQFSKQRGPFCAQRLSSRLRAGERAFPDVYVLKGGFQEFGYKYLDNEQLVVKS